MASESFGILSPSFALPKPARRSSLSSMKSFQEPPRATSPVRIVSSANTNQVQYPSPPRQSILTVNSSTPKKTQDATGDRHSIAIDARSHDTDDFLTSTIDRLVTEEVLREMLLGEFKSPRNLPNVTSPLKPVISPQKARRPSNANEGSSSKSPAPKLRAKSSPDRGVRIDTNPAPRKNRESKEPDFTSSSESDDEPPIGRISRKPASRQQSDAPIGSLIRTRMRPRKEPSPKREDRKPPASRAAPKRR